jgi:putative hydrolase of the HAD superfamily
MVQNYIFATKIPNFMIKNFKNIIFDLGGVLIPLDTSLVNQTLSSFYPHSEPLNPQLSTLNSQLFIDYEVGEISSTAFRQGIRELAGLPTLTDAQIDEAWNSLLLPFPTERIALLQTLAQNHRLFLLSNTNEIHLKRVNELLQEATGLPALESLFEKTYYSHLLHLRKPNHEIYEAVLADMGLPASETCFIDDNQANAEGANAVGITGIWLDLSKGDIMSLLF